MTSAAEDRDAAGDPGGLAAGGELTVVTANLCYGGLDRVTGDDAGWRASVTALRAVRPAVVLLQEVDARGEPFRLWAHLRRTAAALGMEPVLGPSAALRSQTGNHTAILAATRAGVVIEDQWPPPPPAGPARPWCTARLSVPGLGAPLHVYSVHLPARSPAARRAAGEELASFAASHDPGDHVLAGGDFNSYPAAGAPRAGDLAGLPLRWLISRCVPVPGGWQPDCGPDELLTAAGLADLAARHAGTSPAGSTALAATKGGARLDRCYATPALAAALVSCQPLTTGSDHAAVAVTFDLSAAGPGSPAGPPPAEGSER
jgi:endonuclease/exonuclease/phosphatase family metal-dependent hydrolase